MPSDLWCNSSSSFRIIVFQYTIFVLCNYLLWRKSSHFHIAWNCISTQGLQWTVILYQWISRVFYQWVVWSIQCQKIVTSSSLFPWTQWHKITSWWSKTTKNNSSSLSFRGLNRQMFGQSLWLKDCQIFYLFTDCCSWKRRTHAFHVMLQIKTDAHFMWLRTKHWIFSCFLQTFLFKQHEMMNPLGPLVVYCKKENLKRPCWRRARCPRWLICTAIYSEASCLTWNKLHLC